MRQVEPGPARAASSWRDLIAHLALVGMLGFVLIGFDPLGVKVKTIPATGEGDVLRQIGYVGVFAAALLSAAPHQNLRRLFVIPLGMSLLIGYCFVSLLWAVEPVVAARRLVLTVIIIWVIFHCVEQIGYERTINSLRALCAATIALSFLSVVISPVAIHQVAEVNDPALVGNWRGILPHKNFAGAVCAVTVLIFLFDAQRIPLAVRAAVIAAALFFLYKSSSKTSMGILVLGIAAGAAFLAYSPRYRLFVLVGLAATLGIAALSAHIYWRDILAAMTRQDALTGRGEIWLTMFTYIGDNWLLGSGYGAFWNIGAKSPIYTYSKTWVATVANAHSGYVDLLAQIGFPGFALGLWVVVALPLGRLLLSLSPNRSQLALSFAIMSFCIGHNATESSLMDRDMIVQVFLVVSLAIVYRLTARRERAEGRRPAAVLSGRRLPRRRLA